MKISEVMTTDVATASVDTTLEEIATMMRAENVGAIPILDEDDELAGIVTDRDIVVRGIAEGKDVTAATAEDILSYRVDTIAPDEDTKAAARKMAARQIRRLPVVERGRLVGMVSIGDLAVKTEDNNLLGDTLEDVSEGVKQSSRGAREGADPEAQRVTAEGRNRGNGRQPTREESQRNIQRNVAKDQQGNQREVRSSGNRARGTASVRPAEIHANERENGRNTRDDQRSKSWQNREAEEHGRRDEFTEELKRDNMGQHRANRASVTPSVEPEKERKSRNANRRTEASGNRKQVQSVRNDRSRGNAGRTQSEKKSAVGNRNGGNQNTGAGNVPRSEAEVGTGGQGGASRAGRTTASPRRQDTRQYGKNMAAEQTKHDLNRRSSGQERSDSSQRVRSQQAQPQGLKSEASSRKQGIANRKASEEDKRNDKVVPFREHNRVRNTAVRKPNTAVKKPNAAAAKSSSRRRAG